MPDPGDESTLREAIEVMLGHRVIVAGGTATAVIDLSYGPDDHRPPPRVGRRRTRWPKDMPVLQGTATESGRQLAVWCPWEHRYHYHGRHPSECPPGTCECPLHADYNGRGYCRCPVGAADGHRGAHCAGDTPFTATGYYVQEVRP
jgi:hypothetical protein